MNDMLTTSIGAPTYAYTGRAWTPLPLTFTTLGQNAATFADSFDIYQNVKDRFFFEEFSNPQSWTIANPPVNALGPWTVIDSGAGGPLNNPTTWSAYYYSTWTDTVARAYYSPARQQNTYMVSPEIDCSAKTNVHLTMHLFLRLVQHQGFMFIYGSTDNFATRTQIAQYVGADFGPAYPDYDITSWAAGSSA